MSHPAVAALGAMALLMLVQLFFAVAVSTRLQHIPGTIAAGGHDDPFFRASRTVANTNETIAIFVLAVMFCIMSGAAEYATAQAAWAFVVARGAYAICYSVNMQTLRSLCFGLSLLALIALLVIGFFS